MSGKVPRSEQPGDDLALIIVSWNVRDLLESCLESIFQELGRLPGWRASVWVLDNASRDGSAEMVQTRFSDVHLIANAENRGFAAANNQALRALGLGAPAADFSSPRFVALLNPDTTLIPGALGAWLAAMESLPDAGILAAALRYPNGDFQHSAFAFPSLAQVLLDFFPLHHRLINSRINGRYPRRQYAAGQPFPVGHPLGAAMLVRREAIQAAGLLDEGYFIYAEEVDWCLRLRRAGWPAWCVPAAVVIHHEGQSTRQFREGMFVALWRSRLRLFALHYSTAFNLCVRPLVRLGLRRLRAIARSQARRGDIDPESLRKRLDAFDQVEALTRRPAREFRLTEQP